jgi:glycerophosphoryl diester phosphodiesterase
MLWRDAAVPPLLSSFSEEALASAREAVPDLPRALLLEEVPPDWAARLDRLECVAIDTHHEALDAALVRAAHAAGARVLCYTPNDIERVQVLAEWGVDGIITDAVDRIPADTLPPPARWESA